VLDLAARMPFEEAAGVFERLVGIGVSEHFGHQTLNAVGEQATLAEVTPTADEIATRIEQTTPASGELPILVVAADGAHLPTRPQAARKTKRGQGQYREAKGFRLYLAAPDERIVHLASWHQIQDAQAFRVDLAEVAQRIPRDRVRIALLADGAQWLWDAMTACFPEGRPILDYYHVAEHVHAVARALLRRGTRGYPVGRSPQDHDLLGQDPHGPGAAAPGASPHARSPRRGAKAHRLPVEASPQTALRGQPRRGLPDRQWRH
jgi:hypothetical protein